MIEYEYTLERDYGVLTKTFKPTYIPSILPNLVYIEGPNSIGKSALLHILALSFHGLDKNGLNRALRERLKNLVSADYQKLTFNVKVTSRDGSLEIQASKAAADDPEIVVYEINNGKKKRLTPETFHNKYNLIYDIPNNPSERLEQLVKEIDLMQGQQLIKVQRFRQFLTGLIEEIKRGRDPKKIEDLAKKIKLLSSKNEKIAYDLQYKSFTLKEIEKYMYCKLYDECMSKIEVLERERENLEKMKKGKIKGGKKKNQEYEKVKKAAFIDASDLNTLKLSVLNQIKGFTPKEEKNLLEVWQYLDFNHYLKDLEVPSSEPFKKISRKFKGIMETEKKKIISDSEALKEASVYNDLIRFLDNYRDTEIILPGVEKTVDEFIDILTKKAQEFHVATNFNQTYTDILGNLNRMDEMYRSLESKIGEIRRLQGELVGEDIEGPDVDDLIIKNNENLDNANSKAEEIEMELHKRDVSLDSIGLCIEVFDSRDEFSIYKDNTTEQLQPVISYLTNEVKALESSKDRNENTLRVWGAELSRLENEKEHPYHRHKEDLDKLRSRVLRLESKIEECNKYIENIENRKNNDNTPVDEIRYRDAVYTYLGQKVGYIRHIDAEYKVRKIDILKRIIYTDSNEIIRLNDMSTGQGQMAYLLGLLNPNDNRKIIALFDEVAMMSSHSLNPIYCRFRELYNEDRLLIGVVVQKGEEVNIVSKLEGSIC